MEESLDPEVTCIDNSDWQIYGNNESSDFKLSCEQFSNNSEVLCAKYGDYMDVRDFGMVGTVRNQNSTLHY